MKDEAQIERINRKETKIYLTDGTRLKAVQEPGEEFDPCENCYFSGKNTCSVAPCSGVIWVKRKDKK